jgi:hypothetical protein
VLTHCVHTQPSRGWEAGGRTVAGGAKLPDPIWLPDAATAGVELRKALEAVSAPPAAASRGERIRPEAQGRRERQGGRRRSAGQEAAESAQEQLEGAAA